MNSNPNAPEVDVLSVIRDAEKRTAHWTQTLALQNAYKAVAELLTREAALADERDALAAEVGALRLDAERWQTIRDSRSSITLSLHCTAPSERERFIDALRAEAGQD